MVCIKSLNRPTRYQSENMYDIGFIVGDHHGSMDMLRFHSWMKTVYWNMINSVGMYGGYEPTLFLDAYSRIVEHTHGRVQRYMITDGRWSTNWAKTAEVLDWACNCDTRLFVSSADQDASLQDRALLEDLTVCHPSRINFTSADSSRLLLGGSHGKEVRCTVKCERGRVFGPLKISVEPNGDITYHTCDGVPPIIGNWNSDTFEGIDNKIKGYFQNGFRSVCPHYEEACLRQRTRKSLQLSLLAVPSGDVSTPDSKIAGKQQK